MKQQARIYLISQPDEAKRLVKANNQSQAIRHAAKDFKAEVATQDDLVKLVSAGT